MLNAATLIYFVENIIGILFGGCSEDGYFIVNA
jgi:hypothetical protein